MALKLKENLIIDILSPVSGNNKYSKGILNLKTIIKLEKSEGFKISKEVQEMFDQLIKKEESFIKGIPLNVIEKYFFQKSDRMNLYINITFKEQQLNMKVNEIFEELEKLYQDIFILTSILASQYNLEIKINQPMNNDTNTF